MRLENIPVVSQPLDSVQGAAAAGSLPTGNASASAVLHEVSSMLDALARCGQVGVIDLGSVPLSQADKVWLTEKLGHGEVEMRLDLAGVSQVRETAFHGVWWLLHRNENGVVTGEFIEVSHVPDLVLAHVDDIGPSAERLKCLLDDCEK